MAYLYLLILCGYIFSRGFYSFQSICILFSAYITYLVLLFRPTPKKIRDLPFEYVLSFCIILSLMLYGGLYQNVYTNLIGISYTILGFAIFLSVLLIIRIKNISQNFLFVCLFCIAITLRLFMIWSSPNPIIDVFAFQKYGALYLLLGKNPYASIYPPVYTGQLLDYYAYPPGNLLLTVPFVWIFKDPRVTFIIAEIVTALIVRRLIKDLNKYIFPLLILYNPMSLYMIEESYMEPLVILLLLLTLIFFVRKKIVLSSLCIGLAVSSKQYLIALIPLYYRMLSSYKFIQKLKYLFYIGISVFLICFPFYIWNTTGFIKNIIYLQYSYPPRYEGLTLFSLYHQFNGNYIPWISWCIIGIVTIYIYLKKKIVPITFLFNGAFILFTFFLFNKWAFLNYYYLVSQMVLLGIVIKDWESDKSSN